MIYTDNSVNPPLSNIYLYFVFPNVRIFQFPTANQKVSHLNGTLKKVRDADKCLTLYLQPNILSEINSLSRFGSDWGEGFRYTNGLCSSLGLQKGNVIPLYITVFSRGTGKY